MKPAAKLLGLFILIIVLFFIGVGIYSNIHSNDEPIQSYCVSFVNDIKSDLILLKLSGSRLIEHLEKFEAYSEKKVDWTIHANRDSLFFEVKKLERALSVIDNENKRNGNFVYDKQIISTDLERCHKFLLNKFKESNDLIPLDAPPTPPK